MEQLWKNIHNLYSKNKSIVIPTNNEESMIAIESLTDYHKSRGLDYIASRLDFLLIAQAITLYYSKHDRYQTLDSEAKYIVDYLDTDEFYHHIMRYRVYPLDSQMISFTKQFYNNIYPHTGYPQIDNIEESLSIDNGFIYANPNNHKVYLKGNFDEARVYWRALMTEQIPNHPHCYLNESNFNINNGEIIADIGAAEGYFSIAHINKIKHAYIFECDDSWFNLLKKTYAPFKDKVTLIKGYVGDGNGNISLDEYFKDKDKPTFYKLDVEGAEGSVLRCMSTLLHDPSLPMRLAICTYHRQEDAPYFEWLLGDTFHKHYSNSYFWHMPDPMPPFLRRGVMRATKMLNK